MARRPGIFRRDPDSEGEESAESASSTPSDLTPEQAAKEPRRAGKFMAWLGYGPESAPDEAEGEPATELQASTDQPPPPRRGDTEDRIRVAAAGAADAAEQRSIEEILALEENLERAKTEAAERLSELEQRLSGAEKRATSAERDAQAARDRAAELERALTEAEERTQRVEPAKPAEPPPAPPRPLPGDAGATKALQEALAQVQDAEARATAAKQAQAQAERRLRAEADRRVAAETADLRRELETLQAQVPEQVQQAEDRGRRETEEAAQAEAE